MEVKTAHGKIRVPRLFSCGLLKVSLQEALECLAVTSLVTSHFVDGVVGCVAPQHWGAIYK